jgi:hypothetical protein
MRPAPTITARICVLLFLAEESGGPAAIAIDEPRI